MGGRASILALWLATMAATLRARLSEEVDADNVQVSQDQT